MYRRIVQRTLRSVFEGLNRGEINAVTSKLSADAVHYYVGEHPLSGTRRTPESIQLWYERLLRLLPDIEFDVDQIHVEGPPWRTLAVVEWRETNSGTDGVRTYNEGVNVIELRWGKVHRVRIYTDTVGLQKTLDRLALAGVAETSADPIVDH